MNTKERTEYATKRIIEIINNYGINKFALALVYHYGLRSLIDGEDLDGISDIIKGL